MITNIFKITYSIFTDEIKNNDMKKFILFAILLYSCCSAVAQNSTVLQTLKTKYSNVIYSTEGGGWYMGSYNVGSAKYMAFLTKQES